MASFTKDTPAQLCQDTQRWDANGGVRCMDAFDTFSWTHRLNHLEWTLEIVPQNLWGDLQGMKTDLRICLDPGPNPAPRLGV